MDHDKACELRDLMYDSMPDEAITLETLFEAFAMMISETIVNELESQMEALEAFKHVNERISNMIAAADLVGETNWSNKGKMN